MNLRGTVINKYLDNKPEKFKIREKNRHDYIGYMHNDRMDNLLITAYVLANRNKIIELARDGYGKLLSPLEIVNNFYYRRENGFFEACCLDMGFGVTAKDIDKGCKLDYDLYNDELDKSLLIEVERVFRKIDLKTLELF